MIVVFALIIIAVSWYYLLKWRGEISKKYQKVLQYKSAVYEGEELFGNKMSASIKIADRAQMAKQATLHQTHPNGVSTQNLRYTGQLYPDLGYEINTASNVVGSTYSEYTQATAQLRQAISDYNTCIDIVPYSIAAWVFGYKPEAQMISRKDNNNEYFHVADFNVEDVNL